MSNRYLLGYIYLLTLLTISINIFYTVELFDEFLKDGTLEQYREILISAIALEISWVVLFIWFAFEPYKRRYILIIATIPMVIANILNNYTLEPLQFIINLLFLLSFISLYFIGYFLLKNAPIQREFDAKDSHY